MRVAIRTDCMPPTQNHGPVAVPILVYHVIGVAPVPGYPFSISRAEFHLHLQWLRSRGYASVNLDDLVAARSGRGRLPARPVILTFDDGYRDTVSTAAPLLVDYGFTATFFFVTGLLGQRSAWTTGRGFELALADRGQIRQLAALGFECGAHSVTHQRLGPLDDAAALAEMRDSRAALEDVLGKRVDHFAYPYGSRRPSVVRLAEAAGYVTACTTEPRLAFPSDTLYEIPRSTIRGNRNFLHFIAGVRSGRLLDEQPHIWDRVRSTAAAAAAYIPFMVFG